VELLKQNPNSKLILSGGIGLTSDKDQMQITEADAMERYINEHNPEIIDQIIKDTESVSSLGQLCRIKIDYILKSNYKNIALVTDEIHIKRMSILFDAIMGDGFEVKYFGSKINLFGKYRQLIIDWESQNVKGSEELVSIVSRGDHETFKNYDTAYQELRKIRMASGESRTTFIAPKEVLEFMKN